MHIYIYAVRYTLYDLYRHGNNIKNYLYICLYKYDKNAIKIRKKK